MPAVSTRSPSLASPEIGWSFCSWDFFTLCSAFVSPPPRLDTLAFIPTFQLAVRLFRLSVPLYRHKLVMEM